jgi:hypothetical protein
MKKGSKKKIGHQIVLAITPYQCEIYIGSIATPRSCCLYVHTFAVPTSLTPNILTLTSWLVCHTTLGRVVRTRYNLITNVALILTYFTAFVSPYNEVSRGQHRSVRQLVHSLSETATNLNISRKR